MSKLPMTPDRHRSPRLPIAAVCLLAVLHLHLAQAADAEIDRLRTQIDGAYALLEWHNDAGVFRPPQVDGRFVVLDGVVTVVLHNRIQEANATTVAGFGSYALSSGAFSYRYDDWSVFAQPTSGITVSRKLPWEGMRTFTASRDGEALRLHAENGEEFVFTADGIKYWQKGKLLRVWRRLQK